MNGEGVTRVRLSEQEVLEAARRRGADVTSRQLKRWRLRGLVQSPTRTHSSGRIGSLSTYPAEAIDQLVLVAARQKRERRLDYLVINLWWDGHWVDPLGLRRVLSSVHQDLAHAVDEFRRTTGDPITAAEQLEARLKGSHHSDPLFSRVRRRLGGDGDALLTALTVMTHLIFGEEPVWENSGGGPGYESPPKTVFEVAMGVKRAQTDPLPGDVRLLPDPVNTPLEMNRLAAAAAFDPQRHVDRFAHASDDELERARDDAHMFQDLATVAAAAEAMFGTDWAGSGTLTQLAGTDAVSRAQLVSMALIMRELVPHERFAELRPELATAAASASSLLEAQSAMSSADGAG